MPLTFWIVKSPEDYLKAALIQSMVYVFSTLLSWAVLYYKKHFGFAGLIRLLIVYGKRGHMQNETKTQWHPAFGNKPIAFDPTSNIF